MNGSDYPWRSHWCRKHGEDLTLPYFKWEGEKRITWRRASTESPYSAALHTGYGCYLSAAMHSRLLQRLIAPRGDIPGPIAGLSEREFEVLHLLGLGFGTRQIAAKLHRGIKTIEAHRASLKEKLGLKSATELVRFAVRQMEGE